MSSNVFNAEFFGGVTPSSGLEDFLDDRSSSRVWGMGVVIVGRGLGGGGSVAIEGVHLEVENCYCILYR